MYPWGSTFQALVVQQAWQHHTSSLTSPIQCEYIRQQQHAASTLPSHWLTRERTC